MEELLEVKARIKLLEDRYVELNKALNEGKIKQLEERVHELERSIDLIHHILESKQDVWERER